MTTNSSPHWYALAVHTRSEARVASALKEPVHDGRAPEDVFLPIRVERRAWSDRVKRVEAPLFPSYVFVRLALDAARRHALLKVAGVVELVGRIPGDSRIAQHIPDDEIESLRLVVMSSLALDPISSLVRGTRVLVASGALRGARGVVEQGPDGHRRLVVQLGLLGRGVRTVLAADDVVEAEPEPQG